MTFFWLFVILIRMNRLSSLQNRLHTYSKKIYSKPLNSHKKNSFPLHLGTELNILIDDVTNQGLGVGRALVADGSKWVIMVPLVLLGEEVKVRIKRNSASFSEAELVEVLQPSPERIEPLCKYFTICGGCQYQHASITAQRHWKTSQVQNALMRIGGFSSIPLNDVIGTDNVFHYRSKITPHVQSHSTSITIGFQERATNNIIDIEECLIASDAINQEYHRARMRIVSRARNSTQKTKRNDVSLLFREHDGGKVETDSSKYVTQTVNGIKFTLLASDFFQNNPYVVPLMLSYVVEQSKGHDCSFFIDAYCGSGLFSLGAAAHFDYIYGIELNEDAITAARSNAAANGIGNVSYFCGSAENIFAEINDLNIPADRSVLVIDPPRKGCDAIFLDQLIRFKPKKIVYISCDPATQARDAKRIAAAGYNLINVTPFDMFPQTRHIENIVTFLLRS